MLSKFGVSKPTRIVKTASVRLINSYHKVRNSSSSLHYSKKYLKTIREICKKNTTEFKQIIFFLKFPSIIL